YDQALTELTQVVALRRQNAGEYSTALALALEELGDTYQAQGQTATARDNYKAAHAIYDHAVVSRSRAEKMDYQNYYAHVKQLDVKMGKTQ
ncbi:MAG: tetratricopeptide repeat protein, partial [Cyanobacteria bacterium SZAS LIN-2]|nr:tetratricopeptide repeat protein [Cyanobacteria bacterium SZAS LIN-2]